MISLSSIAVRDVLLTLVTVTAGCVDAISYLGLGHVFTANMTGNTALLGLAIAQANITGVLRSFLALVGFVVGAAIGAVIVGRGEAEQATWPLTVTVALTVECLALGVFAVGSRGAEGSTGGELYALIAVAAIAMGIQHTAARRLHLSNMNSTTITGNLASVMEGLMVGLGPARTSPVGSAGGGEGLSKRAASPTSATWLNAAIFLAYGLGAIVGGVAELRWLLSAIYLPIALVLLVIVTAYIRFPDRERRAPDSAPAEKA
jgi:uncharacterized membrane protein YoaK (UPF0700 family)